MAAAQKSVKDGMENFGKKLHGKSDTKKTDVLKKNFGACFWFSW